MTTTTDAFATPPAGIDDAPELAVPVGWKLVPVEPTADMVNAAVLPLNRTGSVRRVWSAMLAAAPATPSDVSKDAGGDERAPVAWLSPGQFEAMGPDPTDEGGATYLPIRRTEAGQFTMPLYAAPPPVERGDEWLLRALLRDGMRWMATGERHAWNVKVEAALASTPVEQPIEDRIRADERERCARIVEAESAKSDGLANGVGYGPLCERSRQDACRNILAALRQSGADKRGETA